MAAGSTYTPIATTTLGSSSSSVNFSSISGSYTDLVIVIDSVLTSGGVSAPTIQVGNGSVDTGTNYSYTLLNGNGTAASSARSSNSSSLEFLSDGAGRSNAVIQIQNYANTSVYKTVLIRTNDASALIRAYVGLWRSTSAINTITFAGATFAAGSQFTLYGIAAA
jgi:hypothetical protein